MLIVVCRNCISCFQLPTFQSLSFSSLPNLRKSAKKSAHICGKCFCLFNIFKDQERVPADFRRCRRRFSQIFFRNLLLPPTTRSGAAFSRLTIHPPRRTRASRLTIHVSCLTPHASRFTIHVSQSPLPGLAAFHQYTGIPGLFVLYSESHFFLRR